MLSIKYNNEISTSSWQEFIGDCAFATPFHTPEFYNFCNDAPSTQVLSVFVLENDKLVALAIITIFREKGIRGFFSRRGIIYGGPLIANGRSDVLAYLLKHIELQLKRRVIYVEIRYYSDNIELKPTFNKSGWEYFSHLNITLNIEGKSLDDIISGFKYNRRRELNQSIKYGAIYKECRDIQTLKRIYEILKDIYAERVKLPLPPFLWFIKLWENDLFKVFAVQHENRIIGGSICAVLNNKSIFTMYYCGLRPYKKNIFPTHLAVLSAIEFGINNNLKYVDFMGAGKPDEEYGVRKYKAAFGGDIVENGRYLKVYNSVLYKLGKKVISFKQRSIK